MSNPISRFTKMIDQTWRESASCREVDPELFFVKGKDVRKIATAKAVCASCIVRNECLMAALASPSEMGIWGGTTKDERNELHEQMRKARLARKRMRNTARLQAALVA